MEPATQEDPDPVNRRSARTPNAPGARAATATRLYRQAWPAHLVTKDSAPFLPIHGDADQAVDFAHSEHMEKALTTAGVEAKLIRIPGGTHAADSETRPMRPTSGEKWLAGSTVC
jgi:dipeptidyl aminopeptidase/acylaminoacyl peptidase